MLATGTILRLQQEQHRHDIRNHFDIVSLPKSERLKHYGLHYAKYVGRLVRKSEPKPLERTIIDTALVCLSAANTLHQHLEGGHNRKIDTGDILTSFADAAGRFADACEKQDHLEDFILQARDANQDIFSWVFVASDKQGMDLVQGIEARRSELRKRAFYIEDSTLS